MLLPTPPVHALRQLARRLRREEGISLVISLAVLSTLTISGTAIASYSFSNEQSARTFQSQTISDGLAEAGLNNAMAVLSAPGTNPLAPHLLPERTSAYEGGTATWSGTLDELGGVWTITSTGRGGGLARTLTMQVRVRPRTTQPLSVPAWNYIYSSRTGTGCDMAIQNSVQVASPLYVRGNLCLSNTAKVVGGPLHVRGQIALYHSGNAVGSSTAPIAEAHVAGGCSWKGGALGLPCSPLENVFATTSGTTPPDVAAPAVDWSGWYLHASPGPYYPCASVSGVAPVFDNDQGAATAPDAGRRNNSLAIVTDLTPPASYVCRTAGGELSWNGASRVLTVRGTVFIDGSARIENGLVNTYEGQAALYLSGTLLVKNSRLCAVVSGGACSASGWDPNARMLVIAANGAGGQVPADVGIQLVSAQFQGALLATAAISIDTTSLAIGPLVGSTVTLGQSTVTKFPPVSIVPAGIPGNEVVLAELESPGAYG